MKYVLSIDQGTSGTKVLLFDQNGEFVDRINKPHSQFYPQPGWVEQDAEEIFNNVAEAIDEIITVNGINLNEIQVVSISNQRETVVVWDKVSGKPIYNAIVWQCNRGTEICEKIADKGLSETILNKTGLVLSPYYSAAKIKWVLDNVDKAREKADKGELLCGTIDSWLIYNLTCGAVHATDYSNASRTQLMNIEKLCWDQELLQTFTIPGSMMPKIYPSDKVFGHVKTTVLAGADIPIAGVLGDSHAALFGQNCFTHGMAKVTYGTGSSIMMNIGNSPYISKKGLVTSIGWGIGGKVVYVAEGNINCSAATIKWLVDDLELIENPACSEEISQSIDSNDGVYFVPAFVGLGTPYWDSEATALITGMTRGTKKAHIVRAACECIAYQVKDVVDIMAEEAGVSLKEIRVDGGASRNKFIMQFQSDMLSVNVLVNSLEEICAIGAAYLGGIATGLWKADELSEFRTKDIYFKPKMDKETADRLYDGWKIAVKRTLQKY